MMLNEAENDRWWIVSLIAAVIGTALVYLLFAFPTSRWVWALVCFISIFVAVIYHNPRFRLWRRANICFGLAAASALLPTISLQAQLNTIGSVRFLSESSPFVVLAFLGSGLVLVWFDVHGRTFPYGGNTANNSTSSSITAINSPSAVGGLTAGGDITINQGISEDVLLAALSVERAAPERGSTKGDTEDIDEELVWRLIDDIKSAKRRFEQLDSSKLVSGLDRRFQRNGHSWPNLLKIEAILILAEHERDLASRARALNRPVDLTKLQELLRELQDG